MEQKLINQAINQSTMPVSNISQKNTDLSLSIEVPADRHIVEAFSTKKIIDCSPREIDIHTVPAVNQAYKFIGKRDSETLKYEINYILENLPNELRSFLPHMRVGEIPIAFKRGLLKEFGDYFGLNVAELLRFCRAHYESIERVNAAKQTLKPEKSTMFPPSKESIFNLYKNNLIEAFNKNLAGNNIEVNAPALYDFCDKLQLILFSTKEKYDIMQEAAHALIKEQHNILFVTVEDYKHKPYKRIIEILTESLQENKPVPSDVKNMLIAKSKCLTLKAFLNDIHINELNLSDLVDNKKDLFVNEA